MVDSGAALLRAVGILDGGLVEVCGLSSTPAGPFCSRRYLWVRKGAEEARICPENVASCCRQVGGVLSTDGDMEILKMGIVHVLNSHDTMSL